MKSRGTLGNNSRNYVQRNWKIWKKWINFYMQLTTKIEPRGYKPLNRSITRNKI
jgi:hypothetical protein